MKAIVLCAGLAMRMRPMTEYVPKCMLPIGGKPLLHHTLECLAEAGVTEVAINLHHLPECVVHDIKRGWQFGLRVTYSFERELLGTAGAIKRLAWWLDDEPFFVVYGDEWTTLDFADLWQQHRQHADPMATIVTHYAPDISGRNFVSDKDGRRITSIGSKMNWPEAVGGSVLSGIYVLDPLLLPSLEYSDLDSSLQAILNSGYHFLFREYLVDTDSVVDVGKPEGYARACALATS